MFIFLCLIKELHGECGSTYVHTCVSVHSSCAWQHLCTWVPACRGMVACVCVHMCVCTCVGVRGCASAMSSHTHKKRDCSDHHQHTCVFPRATWPNCQQNSSEEINNLPEASPEPHAGIKSNVSSSISSWAHRAHRTEGLSMSYWLTDSKRGCGRQADAFARGGSSGQLSWSDDWPSSNS